MSFTSIIGNEEIKNNLQSRIDENNILHSYLFYGKDGIGKFLFAKEFAKKILCLNKHENCDCKSCTRFLSENHPDFFIINPEDDVIKIEKIREITEKIYEKPILQNKKVYIINDAEKMGEKAQNCLLKTLEEPPEYAVIILISSNENLILNTIKSRCTKINFKPIKNDDIKRYLVENNIYTDVPNNLLELFGGSIGKAIYLKDKIDMYSNIDKIISSIDKTNKLEFINNCKVIYDKDEIFSILDYIMVICYKLAKEKREYINCIKIIEDAKLKLKVNSNFDMTIDSFLFAMWEEVNK